jgi:hypothetical protein
MPEESKSLIPLEELGVKTQEDKEIDALTRTSEFLPQVRVYGSESSIVKEQKFPMGHLGLYVSADNIIDLGEQFDCLAIAFRPRATIIAGDQPVSYYEIESKEFQEVKDRAMAKEQSYLAGLEYLLWFPDISKYGLFLMGNPTLRRESPNLKALVGGAATVKIKLIKTAKFTWHGVSVFQCTTPFELPPMEEIREQVANFNKPKSSQVELADDNESSRAR